jgi:hypothetical protein
MKKLLTIALTLFIVSMISVLIPTNFADAQEQTIYKVSGYVLDVNGQGLEGADVLIPEVATQFTNASGYYEFSVPEGTYSLGVWPPYDSNYINYAESGFNVTSDISKNITLQTGCKVFGTITTEEGAPVLGASVHFSDNNGGYYGSGWFTNQTGYYFINVPAGNYTITAAPREGNYSSPTTQFTPYSEDNFAVNDTTIKDITVQIPETPTPTSTPTPAATPAPSGGTELFRVESNSTVKEMSFNATSVTLTFKVSGENGTIGCTKAYIAKTLVPTFTGSTVSLDGKNMNFTITETADYWVFEFIYHHSTHQVVVDIDKNGTPEVDKNLLPIQNQSPTDMSTIPEFTPFTLVGGLVLASVAVALTRKKFSQPLTRTV